VECRPNPNVLIGRPAGRALVPWNEPCSGDGQEASMMRLAIAAAVASAAALTTTAQSQPLPAPLPIASAPADLRPTISRADVLIAAMHDALLRELNDALDRGGPAGAIDSCHIDVTAVSQRLARSHGVPAGRTSDRLRDPTNAPRPWAAAIVRDYAGRRARDVEGFAVDLGDRVGVLRPIVERQMCAGCHGPADGVSQGVRTVLTERYPADRAIGFTNGEIRGWYWVEMPKILR
jgi:hypothetical protein